MSRLDLWSRQSRLIQSSVAYATALLITVTLHEFGHGTAAWLYGFHPMVYGLHEEDIAASQVRVAVIAAAGPLVSLVLGMVFLAIQKRMRGQGFPRYLMLWLGLLGIAVFVGYLITPPFYPSGDVYKVLASFNLASPIFLGISVLCGAIGIVLLGHIGLPRLVALANSLQPLRPQMMALGILSWVLGSILVLVAMLPQFPWMLVAIGAFVPLINLFASRRNQREPYGEPRAEPKISIAGIVLLVLMVVLEHTVLRQGVHL
ncbi:MAG: hypothetical protein WBF45_12170 [Acidobacteriaceae bacterium]